jgi:hypothetical protein
MSTPRRTVTWLHPRTRPSHDLPVSLQRIGASFDQLDALWSCIEQITREPSWSMRECKVACARLSARLPGVRQSLGNLAAIQADRWPDTDWAARLNTARDEVEQRLLDLSSSMSSVLRGEASTADAVSIFSFNCANLVKTVGELCALIAKQYPEAIEEA